MTFFVVKNLGGSGKPEVKKFSDVGLQELFVSRLIDFTRLIDGLIIDDAAKKQNIKEEIMRMIFEGFEPAFISLRELQKAEEDSDYPENKKEKHAKDVISYLVIACKDRMQKVVVALGYDIGFFYSKDINFEQGVKKFIKDNQCIDKKIADEMRKDRDTWQRTIFDIRNILINHQKGADVKEIEELKNFLNYIECKKLFDKCWKATEDVLFILIRSLAPISECCDLRETDAYQKDHQSTERFGWHITLKNINNDKHI